MRRAVQGFALAAAVLLVARLASPSAATRDEIDPATHPFVGSWVVSDQSGIWPTPNTLLTIHADGTALLTDGTGKTWHGAWTPTGERTADFALAALGPDGTTRGGMLFTAYAEVLEGDDRFVLSLDSIAGDRVKGVRVDTDTDNEEMIPPGFVIGTPEVGGPPAGSSMATSVRELPPLPPSTPVPGYQLAGFESDDLGRMPMREPSEGPAEIEVIQPDGRALPATLGLHRYRFEPGGSIELPYPFPGPVLLAVEQGTLGLDRIGPNVTIVDAPPAGRDAERGDAYIVLGPSILTAGGRFTLEAGDYAYAMDGGLGPMRNAGTDELVVVAVLLTPFDESMDEVSKEETGTPVNP